MTTVTSTAWDRLSAVVAAVGAFALLVSLIGLVEYCIRGLGGAYVLGVFLPPGLGVIVFTPLTVVYARAARCRVVITEGTIGGLAGCPVLRLGDITRWELRGDLLVIWAPRPRRGRRAPTRVVYPGVPSGAVWARLDRGAVAAIGDALTAHVGPAGIDRS